MVVKLAQSMQNCLELRWLCISPYPCTEGTNPLHLLNIKGEICKTDKTFCCLAPINVGVGSSPSALQQVWKSWPPWSLQRFWGKGRREREKYAGPDFQYPEACVAWLKSMEPHWTTPVKLWSIKVAETSKAINGLIDHQTLQPLQRVLGSENVEHKNVCVILTGLTCSWGARSQVFYYLTHWSGGQVECGNIKSKATH